MDKVAKIRSCVGSLSRAIGNTLVAYYEEPEFIIVLNASSSKSLVADVKEYIKACVPRAKIIRGKTKYCVVIEVK